MLSDNQRDEFVLVKEMEMLKGTSLHFQSCQKHSNLQTMMSLFLLKPGVVGSSMRQVIWFLLATSGKLFLEFGT